ncbi:MAG TPA: flagellar motor switch phosphatase FliY [Clostridia bacterium]
MGDMLSQAEIDALLKGTIPSGTSDADLDPQEIDALGEIGNISMGTSATTLFALLGQKVTITTPKVSVCTWKEISTQYSQAHVGVRVEYTNGLIGTNLLILKEHDVKVITDLMMGGDGSNTEGSLNELHLSAISEAMNQMVGSSSTSMSSMFDKRIDISPPKAFIFNVENMDATALMDDNEKVVKVAFKMVIGDLVDSEIMQIIPISFAKEMVGALLRMETDSGTFKLPDEVSGGHAQNAPVNETSYSAPGPAVPNFHDQPQTAHQPYSQPQSAQQSYRSAPQYDRGFMEYERQQHREPVNVQPAQFQSFEEDRIVLDKHNINLIMDVPLQITVELGRTQRLIKDILEFSPGSIIELDKLAGEPVDILVNGKQIAKGEVVVIDESFGVRITDIADPSKRL